MNTIEHGDVYAVNGNMLKLEDIGAYAKNELNSEKKGGEK